MSYILDALKKSSEERRKLQQQQMQQESYSFDSDSRKTPQNRLFPAIALVFLITLSTVGAWWYIADKTKTRQTASPPDAPVTETVESANEQKQLPTAPSSTQSVQQSTPAPAAPAPPETPEEVVETPIIAPPAEPINPIPLQQELPLAIRSQIPEMKFSGHVFSETPELRMILIDTTVVRQGDQINPDLKLLEITEDGLIMEFKGNRFKRALFD